MEENKKSYYAIIPAVVRYDTKISANAKLLYGEITALCNEKGYCWAKNEYFANLYQVSKQTISRWIRELKESNYINVQMVYKEGSSEIVNRYIQICEYPINKNDNTPINKNVKDNNTSINNTFNNTTNNAVAEITKSYEDNIGMITSASSRLLLSYLDEGMDYRLIIKAIEISALANKRNANYIKGILNNWKSCNYKVLADLENDNKNHNKQETEEDSIQRKIKELEELE